MCKYIFSITAKTPNCQTLSNKLAKHGQASALSDSGAQSLTLSLVWLGGAGLAGGGDQGKRARRLDGMYCIRDASQTTKYRCQLATGDTSLWFRGEVWAVDINLEFISI